MDPIALARYGDAVATVRAFASGIGATAVVVLIDQGDEPALMVEHDQASGATQVTEGERVTTIAAVTAVPTPPRPLPNLRPTPATAISLDLDTGQLAAPLGTVEHLVDVTRALAGTFGGRSVATAEFATRDPELPITIAAREGERAVLAAGDQQFELGGR